MRKIIPFILYFFFFINSFCQDEIKYNFNYKIPLTSPNTYNIDKMKELRISQNEFYLIWTYEYYGIIEGQKFTQFFEKIGSRFIVENNFKWQDYSFNVLSNGNIIFVWVDNSDSYMLNSGDEILFRGDSSRQWSR